MMTIYLNRDGLAYLDLDIQDIMQPDCLEEDIIRRAIMDVENVYKIEGLAFYSRDWGVKSPASLSNGIKALILCYYYSQGKFDELVANSCMGANVGPYLRELSLKYDFSISWDYFLNMRHDMPVSARDADTGTTFDNTDTLTKFYAGRYGKYDWSVDV